MVRWRIRLLLFSVAEILIAQLLVLTFLPFGARLFDLQVICIALVVLGATLLVSMPEVFRDLQRYRLLVFGLMLMVLMVFRPQGLLTFRDRREAEPEPAGDQEPAAGV